MHCVRCESSSTLIDNKKLKRMVSDEFFGNLDQELSVQLDSLIKIYNISKEDLFYKFESFGVLQNQPNLTLGNISLFKEHLSLNTKTTTNGLKMKIHENTSPLKMKAPKPHHSLMSSPPHKQEVIFSQSSPVSTPKINNSLGLLSSPGFGTSAFTPKKLTGSSSDVLIYNSHIQDTK